MVLSRRREARPTPDAGPTTPPTALWVVPVPELAGVARHVLDVVAVGVPGWRVVVLCPPGALADRLRAAGAPVVTGPVGPRNGMRATVGAVRRTARALRPSVVHSHLAWADAASAVATVGAGAALVTTEHGIARDDLVYHGSVWRSRATALAHTARLRRTDALIAVSRATAEAVRAKWHPPRRLPLPLVRNGVDRVAAPGGRGPGLHVVSVARLAPEKRVDHLVHAFARLRARHPSARLTIAGTGPEEGRLRGLASDLGVAAATDFVGHVDPGPLLDEADVLVQLSVWENCSYSLLDALARGVGVVATPVGGNPEMLPPTALVAHDDPAAVAALVAAQGMTPSLRPVLPPDWPTRADTAAGIGEVYAQVVAS